MKSELNTDQVTFFDENGFLILEGFLDAEELERWRRVTEEAVAQRLGSDSLNNQKDPDAFYSQVFTQCLRLADIHDEMRELVYDKSIGKMAATLAGVDGMRVWHDQALFKPPLGNATALDCANYTRSARYHQNKAPRRTMRKSRSIIFADGSLLRA